jgi:hypothetical protein
VAAAEVKSVASSRFWSPFDELPSEIKDLAIKDYNLWRQNPGHPGTRKCTT